MERDDLLNEEKLPLSVLVVDDEPDYAEAVVNTLERIDAECEVAYSQKDAENYVFHCGWRYLCTANGIDYCIYSEDQGEALESFVAMRLSDKFIPWQVGTAVAAGALLIVALLYFLGLALLLKKLLAPQKPQSLTPQDE